MLSLRKSARLAVALVGAALTATAWTPGAAADVVPSGLPGGQTSLPQANVAGVQTGELTGAMPGTASKISTLPAGGGSKALPALPAGGKALPAVPGTDSDKVPPGTLPDSDSGAVPSGPSGTQPGGPTGALPALPAGQAGDKLPTGLLRMRTDKSSVVGYSLIPDPAADRDGAVRDATSKRLSAGLPTYQPITPAQAVAAAQAAVWHYSQGIDLDPAKNDAVVKSMYRYMTGPSNVGTTTNHPSALLTKSDGGKLPADLQGTPGQLLGPLTVPPGVSQLTMKAAAPTGMQVVDADGHPVTKAKGGDKLYLAMRKTTGPADGAVSAISDPRSAFGQVAEASSGDDVTPMLVIADHGPVPFRQVQRVHWGQTGFAKDVRVGQRCLPDGMGVDIDNTRRKTPLPVLVAGRKTTVPAGGASVVPVPVKEGAAYDIPVSDGVSTMRLAGTRDCAGSAQPVVTAAPDCDNKAMDVLVKNPSSSEPASMNVNGQPVSVPGGTSRDVNVPVGSDGNYLIDVAGDNGLAKRFSGQLSCAEPLKMRAASANTAVNPDGGLPVTGAAIGGFVVGGVLLVGVGGGLFLLARRRRGQAV